MVNEQSVKNLLFNLEFSKSSLRKYKSVSKKMPKQFKKIYLRLCITNTGNKIVENLSITEIYLLGSGHGNSWKTKLRTSKFNINEIGPGKTHMKYLGTWFPLIEKTWDLVGQISIGRNKANGITYWNAPGGEYNWGTIRNGRATLVEIFVKSNFELNQERTAKRMAILAIFTAIIGATQAYLAYLEIAGL